MVRLAKLDSVAVLTIDHPPGKVRGITTLNALSQALRDAAGDPEIRAVVITSTGDFFTPGEIREVEQLVGAALNPCEFTRGVSLRIEDKEKNDRGAQRQLYRRWTGDGENL